MESFMSGRYSLYVLQQSPVLHHSRLKTRPTWIILLQAKNSLNNRSFDRQPRGESDRGTAQTAKQLNKMYDMPECIWLSETQIVNWSRFEKLARGAKSGLKPSPGCSTIECTDILEWYQYSHQISTRKQESFKNCQMIPLTLYSCCKQN